MSKFYLNFRRDPMYLLQRLYETQDEGPRADEQKV